MSNFKQHNLENKEKTLNDFFKIQGNVLSLKGTLQTENFISGKRGVQIKSAGLNTGAATIAGSTSDGTSSVIPGALKHTGSTVGFYNVTPVARQSLTTLTAASGTADDTIADVGGSFNQTTLNNNFKDLATKLNTLITDLKNLGLLQ